MFTSFACGSRHVHQLSAMSAPRSRNAQQFSDMTIGCWWCVREPSTEVSGTCKPMEWLGVPFDMCTTCVRWWLRSDYRACVKRVPSACEMFATCSRCVHETFAICWRNVYKSFYGTKHVPEMIPKRSPSIHTMQTTSSHRVYEMFSCHGPRTCRRHNYDTFTTCIYNLHTNAFARSRDYLPGHGTRPTC
jgi:hypothetical protein